MENENTYETYHFRTINGRPTIMTDQNTKITYTFRGAFRIGRIVVNYERVRIARTARARVTYFMYNNRIARFKRAFVPAATAKLRNYGISITIA